MIKAFHDSVYSLIEGSKYDMSLVLESRRWFIPHTVFIGYGPLFILLYCII